MGHYLTPYTSKLSAFGYPYVGYNIDEAKKTHTVLYSYLESKDVLYIALNDEKVSFINTRKIEVPKGNFNKKVLRQFVKFAL